MNGIIMSHGSSNSRKVDILIKKGVDYTLHSKTVDALGRYIILKAEIKDKIYVLINIYAPNKDKDSFTFVADLLVRLKNENLDEEENISIGGCFRYGYHQRENTGFRLFTEVKPCWTGLISGWVTI